MKFDFEKKKKKSEKRILKGYVAFNSFSFRDTCLFSA